MVLGARPIQPELGRLDAVLAGACLLHLSAVRAYLGEFVEPVTCGLDDWPEVVAAVNDHYGGRASVLSDRPPVLAG